MCVFATYRSIYINIYVVKNFYFYPTTQRTWPSNMARILSILSSLALLILTSAAQDTSALTITYTKLTMNKCRSSINLPTFQKWSFFQSSFTTTTSGIGNMDSQAMFQARLKGGPPYNMLIGSGARGGNTNRPSSSVTSFVFNGACLQNDNTYCECSAQVPLRSPYKEGNMTLFCNVGTGRFCSADYSWSCPDCV
jgi:hypothetical protein